MLITPDTLEALRTEFTLDYQKAYEQAEAWWPSIATQISSSTKSNTYGWVEQAIKLRKWVGPRVALNLKAQKYVLENDPYEGTLEVDRDDIEDDNLGLYKSVYVPEFGVAVKKHPDELISQVITDNTALAYDGLPLFHDAHVLGDHTYDNKDSLSLTADNLNTIYAKMASIKGESGRVLQVRPSHLFHAPQLKRAALNILQAGTISVATLNLAASDNVAAASVENVMKGWLKPVEIPEWGDTPDRWIVADCTKAVKPFVYQLRRPATFVARDNPQDPKVFDLKKFTYGTEGRWAIGITLPWLINQGHA